MSAQHRGPDARVAPALSCHDEVRGPRACEIKGRIIRAGRGVGIEVTPLRAGVDPLAQRAFVSSIEQALKTYDCPGDHVFEQEFQFVLR